MTVLEQRFLETVPNRLQDIEREIKTLNGNFERLLAILERSANRPADAGEDGPED